METEKTNKKPRSSFIENNKYYFFSLSTFLLLCFIVFGNSLNLSLSSDDWIAVLLPKQIPEQLGTFSPYGIQQQTFSFIYDISGSNIYWFYIISLLFKTAASFSITHFIYRITNNKTASLMSGILFLVGFSGIETLSVVNNMNTYLSIIFALLFINYSIKYFSNSNPKLLLITTLLFIIAIIVAPIRMFTLFPFMLTLALFYLSINFSRKKLFYLVKWSTPLLFSFILLINFGSFGPTSSSNNTFIGSAVKAISIILQATYKHDYSHLRNILSSFSNLLFPQEFTGIFKSLKYLSKFISLSLVFITLTTTLLIIKKKQLSKEIQFITVFLYWSLLSIFSFWIINLSNELVLLSYRRYMTVPFVGISLSFGIFIHILSKNYKKIVIYLLSISFLLIHSIYSYNYIKDLSLYRNGKYSNIIWGELKKHVPSISKDGPSFFYFKYHSNPKIKSALFTDFPNQAAVIYNIPSTNPPSNPHATDSLEELNSWITDGKALEKHGYAAIPVPKGRIYTFRIEGDRLIDIKYELFKTIDSLNDN